MGLNEIIHIHIRTHTCLYTHWNLLSDTCPQSPIIPSQLEQQPLLPLSFLLPPQYPVSPRGWQVRPMKMLAYRERSVEAHFSPVPNCRDGGKVRAWQRLHKYLLSNNTAGSRAPFFSWLICHPRGGSAGTRDWLWNSPCASADFQCSHSNRSTA